MAPEVTAQKKLLINHVPNVLSAARIGGACALLLLDYPSCAFFVVFALCALTDMADGWLARKLDAVSKVGATLDTAADLALLVSCALAIAPTLHLPALLWIWIVAIALVKGGLFLVLCTREGAQRLHSPANKAMGLALFAGVFLLPVMSATPLVAVLCFAASLTVANDFYLVRTLLRNKARAGQ